MKFLYSITILLGAFLLFQVQPLVGKYILPWFGNSPSVWTTCLLFFQVMLLAGYAYAHFLSNRLKLKPQILLHLALMLGALLFLPIIPSADLKPMPTGDPVWGILTVLGLTIAVPYLLLASTSPLLQRWHALGGGGSATWRLYAVSNVGSLAALISYPFLIEPYFKLHDQLVAWSAGFAVYVGLICVISLRRFKSVAVPKPNEDSGDKQSAPVSIEQGLTWLLLAGFASALLVATTNRIGQDVPAVPFLFVLPLCLYLITFIIAFDGPRGYVRPLFYVLLPVGLGCAWYDLRENVNLELVVRVVLYSVALFSCCMCCHCELARRKPSTSHLTLFYLLISIGGALGGVFTALIAPQVFLGFSEYPISLLGCFGVVMWVVCRDLLKSRHVWGRVAMACALAGLLGFSGLFAFQLNAEKDGLVTEVRGFYGMIKIFEANLGKQRTHKYKMYHGDIHHGFQYLHPEKRAWKVSYYGAESGIGFANRYLPQRHDPNYAFRLGIVGLGTGTMAVWANDVETAAARKSSPNDAVYFYEIDPNVITLAESHFSYLQDARDRGVDVEISLGDARLVMEKQLSDGHPQAFDILAIDAFSGDSVPMHLLTKECFEIYQQHLKSDGVLAFHISSRYLNLRPVVQALADEFGYEMMLIRKKKNDLGESSSRWALLTKNPRFYRLPRVMQAHQEDSEVEPVLWTDDYSSLLNALW
jgi:hypothetical protein